MKADGFLNQRQRHPVAMTAAIAINLGAVTALLLAKSGYVTIAPPGAIPLINIVEPPPPEPIVEPRAKAPDDAPVRPYAPPPITGVKTEPSDSIIVDPVFRHDPPLRDPEPPTQIDRKDPPAPVTVPAELDGRHIRDLQPPYPPQLLRMGVEGKAVVRVLIGTDGRVKQIAIIAADDPLFADATERQALRKWRFKPATRDGNPVESWKQLTVRFEIKA